MLNLNRATLSLEPINVAVNDAIERATAATAKLPRPYLGASMVGSECLRKIQYDWWCSPAHSARTREIFARGHYFEERSRQLLCDAGFKFAPFEVLSFTAADGLLRGHADGIVIAGPDLPGVYLVPFLWEHKALNAKNWRAVERDGLEQTFPQYAGHDHEPRIRPARQDRRGLHRSWTAAKIARWSPCPLAASGLRQRHDALTLLSRLLAVRRQDRAHATDCVVLTFQSEEGAAEREQRVVCVVRTRPAPRSPADHPLRAERGRRWLTSSRPSPASWRRWSACSRAIGTGKSSRRRARSCAC